ncbi:hypothetical protein C9374_011720 [Naegleria lovaniensis]|uniref:Uncharacterized protein n=1 Tax=Naegleria lovaniensis TaxID=51637 RepID=A0AA88KCH3_NAELO|nr:uncharacterized protein C9374_011720 [Naegleria lovaniensis]KAG2373835.1 hypothetical protein C9374_011720 [Naegleria lovaniensis]
MKRTKSHPGKNATKKTKANDSTLSTQDTSSDLEQIILFEAKKPNEKQAKLIAKHSENALCNSIPQLEKYLDFLQNIHNKDIDITNKDSVSATYILMNQFLKQGEKVFVGIQAGNPERLRQSILQTYSSDKDFSERICAAVKAISVSLLKQKGLIESTCPPVSSNLKVGDLVEIIEKGENCYYKIGKGRVQSLTSTNCSLNDIIFHVPSFVQDQKKTIFDISCLSLIEDRTNHAPMIQNAFSTVQRGCTPVSLFSMNYDTEVDDDKIDDNEVLSITPPEISDSRTNSNSNVEESDSPLQNEPKSTEPTDYKNFASDIFFLQQVKDLREKNEALSLENKQLKELIIKLNKPLNALIALQLQYPNILPSKTISVTYGANVKQIPPNLVSRIINSNKTARLGIVSNYLFDKDYVLLKDDQKDISLLCTKQAFIDKVFYDATKDL